MPALAAIPWLGTAIAGAAGAGGAIVAGKMQSGAASDAAKLQTDAANHSADTLDAAAQRAETFQRQQAEQQWQASQQTQKANYDQARARFSTIAGVGAQYGLPGMTMPDYAPGVDPHYDSTTTPLPGAAPPGTIAGAGPQGAAPTGGNFSDPAYAKSFIDYYAQQPGVNPSVKNDPNYWLGKITSGELGTDPKYIVSKFMTPEGGTVNGAGKAGNPYAMTAPIISAPQVTTGIPTPYQPGTIAGYAGRRY